MPVLKQQGPRKQTVTREDRTLTELFRSEGGKVTLDYLKQIFHNRSCLVPGDAYQTHYKVGQQDVIGFVLDTMSMVDEFAPINTEGRE